ncbi:MAG: DUF1330 domain-containing protein [Litoricolaceae bacterium]|nr:DUF1330 domain-containing protein [Litorivicinaceae bacterium]
MSRGYVLANVRVDDPAGYKASYQDHVGALVQKYHGTFLVRGGHKTDMENSFPYDRLVVIEFPSRQHAEDWYNDPGYQQLVTDANPFIERTVVIVDGFTD